MALKTDYELGYNAGISQANDENAAQIRLLQALLDQAYRRVADDKIAIKKLEEDLKQAQCERDEMASGEESDQAKCAETVQWAVEWTAKQLITRDECPMSWDAEFPSLKASALLSVPDNPGQYLAAPEDEHGKG